jgi:formylglycine-generating enzyme required for sulfatase activity
MNDAEAAQTTWTSDARQSGGPPSHSRYPGPRSFADDQVDGYLFFGRDQEKEELLHRVRASRLLVLFGKSGLGKTSLLQAGLYPRLRDHALLPVPVRFNQPGIDPVAVVLRALAETCRSQGIEFDQPESGSLWEVLKSTDLWKGDVLWTPVLVLDQFEEIFTLQTEEVRTGLATALGELASPGLPTRIRQTIRPGERAPYTDTPPDVRIILSLREEYVGALEQLVPTVPTLFERRFRLSPLTREMACQAVIKPATVDVPQVFATRPFVYKDATLSGMMEFLVNRQGEVEPFQLQIICQYVEQQVAEHQRQGQGVVEVDERILNGRAVMEDLLQDFYRRAVGQLPGWPLSWQRGRARRLCERGLLSPTGHRVSMEAGQIKKQYHMREMSLEVLTEARLLRKESRPALEGFYYELSHDSLTGPVMKRRRLRDQAVKIALGLVILLGVLGGVVANQTLVKYEQASHSSMDAYRASILEILKRGEPLKPVMEHVPAGSFFMGNIRSGKGKEEVGTPDELPVHKVTIKPFQLGKYEVTFEEYDQFAAETGRSLPDDRGWGRGKRSVINVSWEDAKEYAKWLSTKTGNDYRLPTEAEWEYAARSGGKDEIWAGTSDEKQLADYAVYEQSGTESVGSKKPNGLGLYDMSGNVWEWVEDCWHESYKGAPEDGSAWLETHSGSCGQRVLRGGSWGNKPGYLRASLRYWNTSAIRSDFLGFRLVQDIP